MINDTFRPKNGGNAPAWYKYFSYFAFDRSSHAVYHAPKPEILLPGSTSCPDPSSQRETHHAREQLSWEREIFSGYTMHMARKKTGKPDRQLPVSLDSNQQTVELILAISRDEYGGVPSCLTELFADVAA
ncbi:MAG: hypothetical protein FP813_11600, partial [Desulfurivibrio sp.]|nr:hypothetical protein [Desulfurivibrio sp.]